MRAFSKWLEIAVGGVLSHFLNFYKSSIQTPDLRKPLLRLSFKRIRLQSFVDKHLSVVYLKYTNKKIDSLLFCTIS
jgi:hypothetical protein